MQKYNHLIRTSAAVAILSTLFSSPAKASRLFNISFFDDSGKQIGSGSFTDTENATPVCYESSLSGSCYSPSTHGVVNVTHVVNGLGLTINLPNSPFGGVSGFGPLWYADPSTGQEPGSIYSDRYGPHATYGFVFQQNSEIIENFGMGFSQATPTLATGSWSYTIQAKYGSFFYSGSGTFIATSVPEPLNILGASIGLGLILGLKRKIS